MEARWGEVGGGVFVMKNTSRYQCTGDSRKSNGGEKYFWKVESESRVFMCRKGARRHPRWKDFGKGKLLKTVYQSVGCNRPVTEKDGRK